MYLYTYILAVQVLNKMNKVTKIKKKKNMFDFLFKLN